MIIYILLPVCLGWNYYVNYVTLGFQVNVSVLCIKHCTAPPPPNCNIPFKKMQIDYILLHAVLIKFHNLHAYLSAVAKV